MLTIIVVTFYLVNESFGRDGLKLYSIGNNSPWNSSSSWSLSINGPAAGTVPQSNDTLIINCSLVQNVNFTFTGNGLLEVTNTGLLRGDNLNLAFSGNSTFICAGEVKTENISFTENASFIVYSGGTLSVSNSFSNNSLLKNVVSGKIKVNGFFLNNSSLGISGDGTIEAAAFEGSGPVFDFSSVSLIPSGSLISENNWTGSQNNSWDDSSNWAGGIVPAVNANISVLRSVNNPEIKGNVICENLYINSLAALIIYPAFVLEITGNLSVNINGKLLLKNTLKEKSSLILDGNVSGKIQSEYPVVAGQTRLISSPVEQALSGTFLNMYLRTYDESASQWANYIIPTDDPLQVMQGYELYSLSTETRIFEGTPNHISKSFDISNSGNGLNLTGNPFPSFIDWEINDKNDWQTNTLASAIYYPDPSGSGNYAVYIPGGDEAASINNGSRFIAPMQGFFVKAANPGVLTFTANSQVSNTGDSRVAIKNNTIKFRLSNSVGIADETMFRVNPNSSFGFDDNFDALKLQGNSDSPSINLESEDGIEYAISTIPTVNSSLTIPLDIKCPKEGMFSIAATGSINFEYRYPVILEDLELNKFIDLRVDSVYSFYQTPEMNSKRFKITFTSTEGVNKQNDIISQIGVYPGEVRITGSDNAVYTANLFTVDGKLISSAKGVLSEGLSINTKNSQQGMCLLQLFDGKQTITKKIITQ
jgi:hypothetical protein